MKFLSILLLFGASLWAQNDGTLLLSTGSPAAPSQISVTVTGPPGSRTLCFWVVARYPVGNASAVQPQCIVNAPDVFTSTNYATITWTPLQGATGYDVVRLPGQTLQSCTNCLVSGNTTSTSVRDNGSGLTSYTVLNVGGQSCVFYINNRDYPTARVIEQCALPFQFGQCIIFPDLTQQCTAAGGGGTGVTLINTTTPVTGGPITTTGTIACPTCVVSVTGGAPIVSSGGTTPNITCPTCTVGGTTTVTASAPITSSGGTTPNIACSTCYFGTPTQHDVMLMALTQQVTAVPPSTSGYVLTSNGPSSDPSFQPAASSGGTVTNIATTSPITGGPITTTGTIACATCITGSGTTNTVTKFTGSTAIGNSSSTDDGTTYFFGENASTNTFALMDKFPNANPGTVVNTLTKLNASAQAVQILTSDSSNIYGICLVGCGNAGNAQVAYAGQGPCKFDGTTVIRDFVVASNSVNGDCHDAGATKPTNGFQIVGRILTVNGGAGTNAVVDIFSPDSVLSDAPAVTSVTGTAPIVSSGGQTPAISCPTCLVGTPSNHGTIISSATQTVSITSPGTAGQVLTSNGAGADPTYQAAGGGLTCNKYTVTQSPFGTTWTVTGQSGQAVTSTASQTINIVTLGAKVVINALRIKPTTAFAGTSVTKYTMSLGTNASGGSTTSFEPAFNMGGTGTNCSALTVPFAVSDTPFGDCPGYLDDGGSFSGADNGETVTATFTETGGTNLTVTTAGSVDISLCTTTLP